MSSVTVACKVTPKQKAVLEQTASNLGLDKSSLIRKRLLQDDLKLLHLSGLPDDLVVKPEDSDQAAALLSVLQSRYPGYQASALIKGALRMALKCDTLIVSRKLKHYL